MKAKILKLSAYLISALFLLWPIFSLAQESVILNEPSVGCIGSEALVNLTWTSTITDSVDYYVLRKFEGEPDFNYIEIGLTQDTDYIDNNVESDKNYIYKIRAERGEDIFFSNEGTGLAAYCPPALSPPTTSCQADGPHINLNWSSISGDLSIYEVYRDGVKIGSTLDTTHDDGPDITGTVSYNYFIRAIWQDGTASSSDVALVEGPTCPPTLSVSANCIILTDPGGPQVNLSWNELLGVQDYQIYRKAQVETEFSLLTTLAGTSFNDKLVESLPNAYHLGGTIFYYVKAVWEIDQKDSATKSVIIPRCSPFLTVESLCKDIPPYPPEMRLSWTATMNASHYNIYRDGEFLPPQIFAPETLFIDEFPCGLEFACTRTYQVDAIAGPDTLSSDPTTKSIDCSVIEPPSPAPVLDEPSVFCENEDSRIGLSWTPSDNVIYYTLYRNEVGIINLLETSHIDSAVESGFEYIYRVTAFGKGGTYTDSENTQTITAVDCIPPSAPTLGLATGCEEGEPFVNLSWSETTNTFSYDIYQGLSLSELSLVITFEQGSPEFSSRTWKDTSVLTSTTYYYQVVANGPEQVPSSYSNIETISTPSCLPTTPDLSLSRTCEGGNPIVNLYWSTDEANTHHYEIFREDYSPTTPIKYEYDITVRNFTDDSVSPETTYNYKVEAVGYEDSIRSTQGYKSITTYDCSSPETFVLNDPLVYCQSGYPQADLSWTDSPNATFYDLYRNLLNPDDTIAATIIFYDATSLFTDWRFGYALSFDGSNDFVTVPNDSSLNPTDELTVETWVKAVNIPYHSSNQHYILSKRNYPNYGWWLYFNNEGRVRFNMRDGAGGGQSVQSSPLDIDKWYHVVATVVDNSDMKLYINGSLVATRINTILTAATDRNFKMNQGASNYSFNGIIDETRIYNRALSATEVTEHYNAIFNDGRDLVGWWHLSEGTGQIVYDGSIYGNHGVLGSGVAVETSDPTWIQGGPVPEDRYSWQAKATGPGGSTFSNTTNPAVMPICPPTKPGLVLYAYCESSGTLAGNPVVKLFWTFSVNTVGYEIYRQGATNPIKIIISSDPEFFSRSWTDDNQGAGLTPENTYTYWVRAIGPDPLGYITESDHLDITTPSCFPPTQPQNLTASFECNGSYPQIRLTWEDSQETSYYYIYRNDGSSFGPIDDDDSPSYAYIDAYPSVAVGTDYSYYVKAYGPGGVSDPSDVVNITSGYCPFSKPSIGLSTDCEIFEALNTISWSDETPFNTDIYEIYQNSIAEPPIITITPDMPEFSSRTWKDKLLLPLTSYTYWVKTVGPADAKISDPKSTVTYGCGLVPTQPSLGVTAGCCGNLPCNTSSWTDSANAYSYNLYRTNPDNSVSTHSTRISPFTDKGNFVLNFDGVDDYIDCGNNDDSFNTLTEAFTLEAWIKPNQEDYYQRLIYRAGGVIDLALTGTPKLGLWVRFDDNTNSGWQYANTTLSWGQWYHVVATFSRTDGRFEFYLNGQDDGGTNIGQKSVKTTTGNMYIGSGGPMRWFNGTIDEVRIYNRALDPTEITEHYQGIYENEAGLRGAWHFDEGEGQTAFDSSGYGNHGIMAGPLWVNGKINGALEFNGFNDYFIKNPFNIPSTEISTEFWIKSSDTIRSGTPLSYAVLGSSNEFLLLNYRSLTIYVKGSGVGTGISLTDGIWHHVVVTWRSSDGQVKLYKDGVQAYLGTLRAGSTLIPGGSLVFAQEQDSVGGGFDFDQALLGLMDEVRIYNRVLTPIEISEHYVGTFTDETGLLGLWHFDEGEGYTAFDVSGYGNNGTLFRGQPESLSPLGAPTYIGAPEKETLYKYYVRAFGVDRASAPSNEVSITSSSCLPGAPTLAISPQCEGENPQLLLSWDPDPLTEYWSVYKRREGEELFTHPLDISPPTTSYPDGDVESGVSYEYYLEAMGVGGEGTLSNLVTKEAPFCHELPSKPTITASPQCSGYISRIKIEWEIDPTGNTISYNIWRKNTTLEEPEFSEIYSGLPADTTQYDDVVEEANSYIYKVEAVGSGEDNTVFSDPSSEVTSYECSENPPFPPILSPNFVYSVDGIIAVSIGWTDAGNEEEYKVFRRLEGESEFAYQDQSFWKRVLREFLGKISLAAYENPLIILEEDVLNYVDYTVTDDVTYEYQIMASNKNGDTLSNIISVYVPIARPGDFELTGSWVDGTSIYLTWNEATTTEAGGPVTYKVYRDSSEAFESPTDICTVICEELICDKPRECYDNSPSWFEKYYKAVATNNSQLPTESNIVQIGRLPLPIWKEIPPW